MSEASGQDISVFFARLGPEGSDEWTDEQWAEHDERIRLAVEERARAEAVDGERKKRQWLVSLGVPAKDIELVLAAGGMVETKALRAVKDSMRDGHRIVVLSGTRGSGKTTAAAWWVVQEQPRPEFIDRAAPVFVDATKLSRWPRYDEGRMDDLERAAALVIDDLGVEYDDKQGNFRSLFDSLVNARYASMLPTVITTNLNADEFKARYGERVADRIREVGRFVSIADESLRGRR